MKDDAIEETITIQARPKNINQKYKSGLPITRAKYNDLKKLCDTGVIPKIFHKEYLQLQTVNIKDVLVNTDIEDSSDNNK
ncbi:unnamed protein product [Euphydryas editha]|uniref:Reverse transcriptase n=1 Tax=Euphydryas editha TaxID=104508 RepID=A0AAU9UC83_EUPED|nr:unnamed protein product [Euphydryas editha]